MNNNVKYALAIFGGILIGAGGMYSYLKFAAKKDIQTREAMAESDRKTVEANSIYISKKPDPEEIVKTTDHTPPVEVEAKNIMKENGYIPEENHEDVNKDAPTPDYAVKHKIIDCDTFAWGNSDLDKFEYSMLADKRLTIIDDLNEILTENDLEPMNKDILYAFQKMDYEDFKRWAIQSGYLDKDMAKKLGNSAGELYVEYEGSCYGVYKSAYDYYTLTGIDIYHYHP